jgi:uncharacterized MnhB-related membrane protein
VNTILLIQITILAFVAISGTAVVLTREPRKQVIGLTFYGLVLALAFFIFQAPDVALSQLVIGAVALPLMFMLALTRIHHDAEARELLEKGHARHSHRRPEKGAA